MRGILVAIDLETTGLDPKDSQIIEIGAVKFRDGQIFERYTTMVDPGIALPPRVTAITGIQPQDLVGAPKLADVLPAVQAFVGDALLVGQNIEFDLGFLNKAGILKGREAIDTYDLASVLLPTTPRYNLNALMQALQLEPEGNFHRALADADATARVYMALWERLQALPSALIDEVIALIQEMPWRGRLPFLETAASRTGDDRASAPAAAFINAVTNTATNADALTTHPTRHDSPLTLDDVLTGYARSHDLAGQQTAIVNRVLAAFNDEAHVLIETGDGVERVTAFLLPASAWAQQRGERVVIAVQEGAQQQALINGPIAALQAQSSEPLLAATMKGRDHYLCPGRLRVLRRRLPTSIEELRVLSKIIVGLHLYGAAAGNRDVISLRGPAEYGAWARLSAQDEQCTIDRCETEHAGACPFYQARKTAEQAHLVVVDHALLVADAQAGDAAIPPYQRVIVDAANALEDTVTFGVKQRLDAASIRLRLADMGTGNKGLLGNVISSLVPALPAHQLEQLRAYIATIAGTLSSMEKHVDDLFSKKLYRFLEATEQLANSEFTVFTRLTTGWRERAEFAPVREAFERISGFNEGISGALARVSSQLISLRGRYEIADLEDLIAGTAAASRYAAHIQTLLKQILTDPQENMVYWIEFARDNFRVSLHCAPVRMGPLLSKYLWDRKQSVVMMGSALQTTGNFSFVRERLGAERHQVEELALHSTHDYAASTLLILPTDMPEPSERDRYQKALERAIIELATVSEGHLMALFTSFTQMRLSGQNLAARLALGNISVFDQSDGTSLEALIEGFRASPKSVLLGSRGFWDGPSFSPELLRTLVIARLPFSVPSDPIVQARGDSFEDSFNDFMLPESILKLRQAVGRMDRGDATQRGVIAILDRRMTSKGYGRNFIESLPPYSIVRIPLSEIGTEAARWLGK